MKQLDNKKSSTKKKNDALKEKKNVGKKEQEKKEKALAKKEKISKESNFKSNKVEVDNISKNLDKKKIKDKKNSKIVSVKDFSAKSKDNSKEKKGKEPNKEKRFVGIKRKNKEEKVKLDYKTLTVSQIEAELNWETGREKYFKILRSTIYSLIIVAAVAALIATLVMPVLQISGSSMTPTFTEGEIVVSLKTKNLETGDIIAFYHGNKILVKRVIAGAGSYVDIDEDGNVYVDGKLIDEPYIEEKSLGEYDITFPYQVPDGQWFVLGDHRLVSIDSRSSEIGCVEQEDIVGKIIFRVWPLKKFGKAN